MLNPKHFEKVVFPIEHQFIDFFVASRVKLKIKTNIQYTKKVFFFSLYNI